MRKFNEFSILLASYFQGLISHLPLSLEQWGFMASELSMRDGKGLIKLVRGTRAMVFVLEIRNMVMFKGSMKAGFVFHVQTCRELMLLS